MTTHSKLLQYTWQNVKSEETSILELFSRSKCNKRLQKLVATEVVEKVEVMSIDSTDTGNSELECNSNSKV